MMETLRIGSLTITVRRVDDKGALLYFHEDRYGDEAKALSPSDRRYEILLVPLFVWCGIEKLFTLRDDVEKLQSLLMSDADWPAKTGDDRTDLVAQRSAMSSRLNDATTATMSALNKLR